MCVKTREANCLVDGIFSADTPPPNSEIKVVVFSEDNVPVMRCRSHTEGNDNQCEDFIAPLHFMRCENQSAIYHCCKDTGTLSLSLPFMKPESKCISFLVIENLLYISLQYYTVNYFPLGVAENVENFTFLCSSRGCVKKEVFVKFSLINSNVVLGHHTFGLHVCSTPGRDRMNHEAGKTSRKRKRPAADSEHSDDTVLPPSQETYEIVDKHRSRTFGCCAV
ncbi:cellular tumor antigen p53-like isoform X2 [Paramuricea clavata]|uniref:Cellular tumor antigen p53-like isoform X2 n=1 Tax=Paramuricea clavata TaxID=317549 RepID=A0A6S7H4A4_PARCT|nr:cellular tumor antigen p53-like isoform X2 [Paramuricea clavata]